MRAALERLAGLPRLSLAIRAHPRRRTISPARGPGCRLHAPRQAGRRDPVWVRRQQGPQAPARRGAGPGRRGRHARSRPAACSRTTRGRPRRWRHGWDSACVLVANGTPPARPTANALLDRLLGAEVRYVASREARAPAMDEAAAELRGKGRRPFVIPLGASTPSAPPPTPSRSTELLDQIHPPDLIVLSTSSGGTQAGVIAGCRLQGLRTRVIGISADDPSAAIDGRSGESSAASRSSLGCARGPLTGAPIDVDDRFVGDGYGIPTPQSTEAIELSARREALLSRPDLHGQGDGRAHRAGARRRARRHDALLAHRRAGWTLRLALAKAKGKKAEGRRQRQMISITFLGAARTVTGSKYLVESSGTRDHGGRRAVPGPQGAARAKLAGPAGPRVEHRGDRADARAPRSLRLPAAAGVAGIPRPRVLHAGHAGSVQDRAARRRAAAGRRRGLREPPQLLEAQAGAAALHRSRRLPRRVAAAADRLRPADAGRGRHRGRFHQRGSSARLVVRADADRRTDRALRRRPRPLRPAGPARSHAGRRGGLPAGRVHLRQSRARAGRQRRSDRGDRQGHREQGREADRPGVRDRARRGADLLAQASRVRKTDSGAAGLRRQSDGRGGARALHRARPRARSRDAPGGARRQGAARRGRAASARCSPAPGDAGARDVRVLHRAVSRHRQRRGVQAADRVEDSFDRDLGERDGGRRPRAAPSQGRAARREEHRPLRGLPGRRYPRAPARGRREEHQDPRGVGPGRGADRAPRLDVGPRRRQRDHALARRLHRAPETDLHRPRRTNCPGRAGRAHPG